jgi:signal transduction histidine kinase
VLSVIVTDGGSAPTVEEQQRAFDAFATARPGDPYGVTLATVRRTVAAARGTIWVDASREGGTAVHLLLPIAPG